jgi:hypothetical protein
MAYAAGQPDSPLVAAPRVVKDADGWDSAIQVENSSSLPTVVSLTLSDEDGSRAFHTDEPMPPGASRTYYLPAIGELQSGFRGSALVTSTTPGHPGLGVVVNTAAKQ